MNPFYSVKANVSLYNQGAMTPTSSITSKKGKNISFGIQNTEENDDTPSTKIKSIRPNGIKKPEETHNKNSAVYNIKRPNEKYVRKDDDQPKNLAQSRNIKKNINYEKEDKLDRKAQFNTIENFDYKKDKRIDTYGNKETPKEELKVIKQTTTSSLSTLSKKSLKSNVNLNYDSINNSDAKDKKSIIKKNVIVIDSDKKRNQPEVASSTVENMPFVYTENNMNASNFEEARRGYQSLKPSQKQLIYNITEEKMDDKIRLSSNLLKDLSQLKDVEVNTDKIVIKQDEVDKLQRININDFTITSDLIDTIYGKVFRAFDLYGNYYTMLRVFSSNSYYIEQIFNQMQLQYLQYNNNDFLLRLFGISIDKLDKSSFSLNLLMEPFEYDLETHINLLKEKNDHYREKEILMMLKSIISGLRLLSNSKSYHGDISTKSVVFVINQEEDTFNVKLALPQIIDIAKNNLNLNYQGKLLKDILKRNELFISPALYSSYNKNRLTEIKHDPIKSDIYSVASVILYAATLSNKPLFLARARIDSDSMKKIISNSMKGKYSSKFIELLCSMLHLEEKKRPSYDVILFKIDELLL